VEPDKIRHPLIGYERWQLATDAHISLVKFDRRGLSLAVA
jgi:hypothetical protein